MIMANRERLVQLLGKSENCPIQSRLLKKAVTDTYVLEHLMLELNRIEAVPALFAYPCNRTGPVPLVIYNHSHGGNFSLGKQELVSGAEYLQDPPFLPILIKMGFAVGCIDMYGFGERQGKKESELVKEFLVTGHTLWGLRIFDNQQFLTYLSGRPEVDSSKIATIGMSMGGLMSWWLAAIDPRIQAVVDIAGQVDLETLISVRGTDHHGFYYYVPNLLTEFSTLAIQSLIAPRARLSLTGKADGMCPITGVLKLNQGLTEIYQTAGQSNHWQSFALTGGHQETAEMRMLWQQFLNQQLAQ